MRGVNFQPINKTMVSWRGGVSRSIHTFVDLDVVAFVRSSINFYFRDQEGITLSMIVHMECHNQQVPAEEG